MKCNHCAVCASFQIYAAKENSGGIEETEILITTATMILLLGGPIQFIDRITTIKLAIDLLR